MDSPIQADELPLSFLRFRVFTDQDFPPCCVAVVRPKVVRFRHCEPRVPRQRLADIAEITGGQGHRLIHFDPTILLAKLLHLPVQCPALAPGESEQQDGSEWDGDYAAHASTASFPADPMHLLRSGSSMSPRLNTGRFFKGFASGSMLTGRSWDGNKPLADHCGFLSHRPLTLSP